MQTHLVTIAAVFKGMLCEPVTWEGEAKNRDDAMLFAQAFWAEENPGRPTGMRFVLLFYMEVKSPLALI